MTDAEFEEWPADAIDDRAEPGTADSARTVTCTLCWSPPGTPCQRRPAGDHLQRCQDAERRGVLGGQALADVVGRLEVIAPVVVVVEDVTR